MDRDRDPYFLGKEAWRYGAIRDVRLHAIVSTEILWSYEYTTGGDVPSVCGGFPGPFEALAHALQRLEQLAKERSESE